MVFSCIISIIHYKIITYITILGGFFSVIIAFLMPGLLYIKNNNYPITYWKNICTLILILILTIVGFTAGIMAIIDIFNH